MILIHYKAVLKNIQPLWMN